MFCCVGESEYRERQQHQIYYATKVFLFAHVPLLFKLLQNITSSVWFGFSFSLVCKLTFLIMVFSTADKNPLL